MVDKLSAWPHTQHMPNTFNTQLDTLLSIIDAAVDASTDVLRAEVLSMPHGPFFPAAVVDAAIAEYAAHGWRVFAGRKAGTWLRLERDSFATPPARAAAPGARPPGSEGTGRVLEGTSVRLGPDGIEASASWVSVPGGLQKLELPKSASGPICPAPGATPTASEKGIADAKELLEEGTSAETLLRAVRRSRAQFVQDIEFSGTDRDWAEEYTDAYVYYLENL